MNMRNKFVVAMFVFTCAISLRGVQVGSDECKMTHDSPISKVIKATYRSFANQTFLTLFMIAELMLRKNDAPVSLADLYGSWVIVREIIGQLKQDFEGVPYVSNADFTCMNYLAIAMFLPFGIKVRSSYVIN